MNNAILNPVGIDVPIGLQSGLLYSRLMPIWGEMGLSNTTFQMYPRVYRNYSIQNGVQGFTPQAYTANGEYLPDMFFDDRIAVVMWYGLNDPETITDQVTHNYNVSLYGFVNLDALKPGFTAQRVDMAITNDVLKLCYTYGFNPTAVYRDIDHVLEKYSGGIKKLALNQDMQPRYAFRIDMTNTLLLNNCNSVAFNYPTYQNAVTISYTAVLKDTPNTSIRVPLSNGQPVQLEFPTGPSVTIPYLAGKIITAVQMLNLTPTMLTFDPVTGTLTGPAGGFNNDDVLIIDVNVP